MGVAKADQLVPLDRSTAPVEPVALVLGGGITGMTAAKAIAMSGFEVYLVERRSVLGGLLNRLHKIWPTEEDPKELLEPLRKDLESIDRVHILTSTELRDLKGLTRLIWRMGIKRSYRGLFWRTLIKSAWHNPRGLRYSIALMALYLHFGGFREYVVSRLDRAIRKAEEGAAAQIAIQVVPSTDSVPVETIEVAPVPCPYP